MSPVRILALLVPLAAVAQQPVEVAEVGTSRMERSVGLSGELLPYEQVQVHARVPGYVERVFVDVGSAVARGQLLAELSAPEMDARIAEANSRVGTAEAGRVEAEAQLAAAQATFERLKKAAETPGAVSGNELTQAGKQVEAARALARSRAKARDAASAELLALEQIHAYLKVSAPFEGVITERLVDPGALVKPDSEPGLFVLQKISPLRLAVAVPEQYTAGVAAGAVVSFSVPAFPGRTFTATVRRFARAVDRTTRTAQVQADFPNRDRTLAPGMYAQVSWPVRASAGSLTVPATSVVRTTERTFVIRVRGGRAEWVDVRPGASVGDVLQVTGRLAPGDLVVRRATDEVRDGASIAVKRGG